MFDEVLAHSPNYGCIEFSGLGTNAVHWVKADECSARVRSMLQFGYTIGGFRCADKNVERAVRAVICPADDPLC